MTPTLDLSVLQEWLVATDLVPDERTAVFVGGSQARGWANADSDIDLYVVSAAPFRRPDAVTAPVGVNPGSITMGVWQFGGVRCDIEYWLDEQVDQVIDAVGERAYDSLTALDAKMTGEELYLLERLAKAAVVEGEEWVQQRIQRLHDSAYQRVLVARAFNNADGFAEDAVGQLRADDLESATLSARLAFQFAVDGLLAKHGEYGRSPKWRARRFRAAHPPELSFDDYWDVEMMRRYDAAEPRQWISDVIRLCRRIMTEVNVG